MPRTPRSPCDAMREFNTVAVPRARPRLRGHGPRTPRRQRHVDLGHAEELSDLVLGLALRDVDGLAAERAGVGQTLGHQSPHNHDGSTEQLGEWAAAKTDRAGPGHVHRRARPHPGADTAVIAGGGRCPRAMSGRGSSPWPGPRSGKRSRFQSAYGTITYSACPPTHPPCRHSRRRRRDGRGWC